MLKNMSALSVLACLAVGCATARTSQLRVVDAASGQPLSGVRVDRLGFMWQPAMPGIIPVRFPFPLETVMSDRSGSVQFREKGTDFALEKEGYEWTRLTGTRRGFKVKDSHDLLCIVLPEHDSVQVPLHAERAVEPQKNTAISQDNDNVRK